MIQVDVELKRIQTFLFQVPQLKAMLGANALVGEVMRVKLAQLAENHHAKKLKENFNFQLESNDPLQHKDLKDDPAEAYQQGILARDGGHFSVLFKDETKAVEFMRAAENLLCKELPEVLFELRKKPFGTTNDKASADGLISETIADLPVLQICTATGQGPATVGDKKEYLSHSTDLRLKAGERFYRGETQDILGLLRKRLNIDGQKQPHDLNNIADGGYLALIHADGNGIGKRYQHWKAECSHSEELHIEAHGEQFFYSMRVAMRQAVVQAINQTFNKPGSAGQQLYQPLMLGGDDLVMVCRADLALTFCRQLCLDIQCIKLSDGKPLTLGIGVAIAQSSYPFYRLHELAEELVSSAKRLARGQSVGQEASVIDWQVVSQSSFSDLAATRRRADCVAYGVGDNSQPETLLLNQRPYPVLELASSAPNALPLSSLAELMDAAEKLKDSFVRSALRGLRSEYEKGRLHGELAFANLLQNTRDALAGVGIKKAWYPYADCYSTPLFDLIQLTELPRLGKRTPK